MYKTLKELQEKYPIGSVYHISWRENKSWCPSKSDVLCFKNQHPNARNFMICDNDFVTAEEKHEDKVEGYIFDGKYWYPAVQTWDGWLTIDEEDCNV